MITVRQVMNQSVVVVRPELTVEETVNFLSQSRVGSCPVVDSDGRVAGIISEFALFDVVFDESVKSTPVSQYMTTEVHVVHPDDSLTRVAQLFALYDFRRFPVVENSKLIGIISRRDVMNYVIGANHVLADPLVTLIPTLAPMS